MLNIRLIAIVLVVSTVGCVYPGTTYTPPGYSSTYQRYSLAAYQSRIQAAQNSQPVNGNAQAVQASSVTGSAPENLRSSTTTGQGLR